MEPLFPLTSPQSLLPVLITWPRLELMLPLLLWPQQSLLLPQLLLLWSPPATLGPST